MEKVSILLWILSSRVPRVGPGNIVILISTAVTSGQLGFEENLVCVRDSRKSIYFISVLGEGHGL